MKIVCDSCATKYSISDDKVRGKVFKIRCKKCSHIIVVRGTADAAAAPAAAAASEGGGWHLVVEGEQVGPLPEGEIRARLGRGEINGETYVWKEGLADWLKLATVPEFADMAGSAQPADVSAGGSDLFTDSLPLSRGDSAQVQVDEAMVASSSPAPAVARGGGGGLFSAIDAAAASPAVSSARVGRGGADHDDGFGAPMAARGGGGDLFASHAVSSPSADDGRRGPAANHDGGRVENLTAQRHENSVLFSLANLQQLAMPSAAPRVSAPVTNGNGSSEGSGLIDIRAMAATTLGAPNVSSGGRGGGGFSDDLPTFGSFSAAAPVLLPIPTQSGPPKWIYGVIGGMVLLVIGIAVMAYKILTTKPVTVVEQVQVPAPTPPPTAVAVAPKAAAAAPAAPAIPDENLPPREGAPGSETTKAAGDGARHEKGAGGGKEKKGGGKAGGKDKKGGASAEGGGKAAVAAPAPEPEKKGPAKGSLDDLLENALSGKKSRRPAPSDDDSPAPRKSAAAPAEAAGPLSKSAVVSGMNGIKPKINDCYNQFKVPGMAMVAVAIGKSGKVTSATVSGKFAGTPTGTCVEKAVKSASFPPSEGLNTPYPFQLK